MCVDASSVFEALKYSRDDTNAVMNEAELVEASVLMDSLKSKGFCFIQMLPSKTKLTINQYVDRTIGSKNLSITKDVLITCQQLKKISGINFFLLKNGIFILYIIIIYLKYILIINY